jgi:hypothetical protein
MAAHLICDKIDAMHCASAHCTLLLLLLPTMQFINSDIFMLLWS